MRRDVSGVRAGRPRLAFLLVTSVVMTLALAGCADGGGPGTGIHAAADTQCSSSSHVTYGMSGTADWQWQFYPGGSTLFSCAGYDARMIRDIVPDCVPTNPAGTVVDCTALQNGRPSTLSRIQRDLFAMGAAPISLSANRLYVTMTCDIGCTAANEPTILKHTLEYLWTQPSLKSIVYWAAQNEPMDGGMPTNSSVPGGGATLAAKLWVTAEGLAVHPATYGRRTVVAGEFAGYQASYIKTYMGYLEAHAHPEPRIWSIHPYNDAMCANTTQTTSYDKLLRDETPTKFKRISQAFRHMWLTETGVKLDFPASCTNGNQLQNLNGGGGIAVTAQKKAAQAIMDKLPAVDSRIDHILYWTAEPDSTECWSGGAWDTGLWSPDFTADGGPARALRPAWFVLNHQHVPPASAFAASTLLAPVNYANVCSSTSVSLSGIPLHEWVIPQQIGSPPAPNPLIKQAASCSPALTPANAPAGTPTVTVAHGTTLSGTGSVARGAFAISGKPQLMPYPSSTNAAAPSWLSFQLYGTGGAAPCSGVPGANSTRLMPSGSAAVDTYSIDTSSLSGKYLVFVGLADPIYKSGPVAVANWQSQAPYVFILNVT